MTETTAGNNHFGIYVHIPFCLSKCPYCSFYSIAGSKKDLHYRYITALHLQIDHLADLPWTKKHSASTIFFGGGTPSVLSTTELARLLSHLATNFPSAKEKEISIEVNPATINLAGLKELHKTGFNRISLGLQSLNDEELLKLGRIHSALQGMQAVRDSRQAGFDNINIDLMFGLPEQDLSSWKMTLNKAISLNPSHLSIYELTVEEKTPFHRLATDDLLALPQEEEILAMMDFTDELTKRNGYSQYEISNYSRPGKECHHNINYWENGDYLGFGSGAVSCLSGHRMDAIRDVKDFCTCLEHEQPKSIWKNEEVLDREARFRETMIMGLRMTRGVHPANLTERFDIDPLTYYGDVLRNLARQNLLRVENDCIQLTRQGLRVANSVMAELV